MMRNKLSLGLDLKQARGLELLMALWKISDVWMEASAPGTCERAGISNELALAVNPALVIVRVSTYGQYGKEDYLGRPGYDALAQAYGGMMNVTGDPSGPPQRAKVYTGDYITALTGWASTMMALWEVKKTGRGQVIDLAQYRGGGANARQSHAPLHRRRADLRPHRQPRARLSAVRYVQVHRRLGVHRRRRRRDFRPVAAVSGPRSEQSTPTTPAPKTRPRSIPKREGSSTVAYGNIAPCVRRYEVETALNEARIGCARVFGTPDQYSDEHYRAREMTVPVLDRQSGVPIRVYGVVPKMSLTPGRVWRGAPAVGEDTTDVLSKLLGLSDEDIARLYTENVVHRTEPFTEPQVEAVHP